MRTSAVCVIAVGLLLAGSGLLGSDVRFLLGLLALAHALAEFIISL